MHPSLRTADVFPVVASLPPKNNFIFRIILSFEGREATTVNTSAVRRLCTPTLYISHSIDLERRHCPGGGGTPFNGLYGVAPPERGTFFRLRLYEREGISLDDENKSVGKSVIYLRSVKRRKRAKY